MARSAHNSPRMGYLVAAAMLVLALLFPVGLMVFNPTLMFERGWEQYVGTAIYFWAVLTLGRELLRLWRNERAFEEAPALLQYLGGMLSREDPAVRPASSGLASAIANDGRILPVGSASSSATSRDTQPVGQPAHGGQPRGLGARPGAHGRPVHPDALHPLPAAGHRLHRHGRGDLEGPDEHQRGACRWSRTSTGS